MDLILWRHCEAFEMRGKGTPKRSEQQLAQLDEPSSDHDEFGIKNIGESGKTERYYHRGHEHDAHAP